jgi:penicillin-binding protein 1A
VVEVVVEQEVEPAPSLARRAHDARVLRLVLRDKQDAPVACGAPGFAREPRQDVLFARVLDTMLESRAIDARQYRAAVARPLGLRPGRLYQQIREPYFFGYVRDLLIREYGAETVRSGGLTVYTTIIPRYQRYARIAINRTLTEPTDPAAAVVSIDPRSGAIRAMTAVIPSRRGKRNEFNLLSQARRQPGSTFKTFVLTSAVAEGSEPEIGSAPRWGRKAR